MAELTGSQQLDIAVTVLEVLDDSGVDGFNMVTEDDGVRVTIDVRTEKVEGE